MQLYVDLVQSRKHMILLSRLKKVSDLEIRLRTRSGEERTFLFSARTLFMGDSIYLITFYNDISSLNDGYAKAESEKILREIFDSMSSYVAIFRRSDDNKLYIMELNSRAEEVEQIGMEEVIGREFSKSVLKNNRTLASVLKNIQTRQGSFREPVSPDGDDKDGYYIGLLLSTGDMWLPGRQAGSKKSMSLRYLRQGIVFETFAELLPEMIMELDTAGHVTFMNTQGMLTLGFNNDDLSRGVTLSELITDDDLEKLNNELAGLTKPGQITFDEYVIINKQNRKVSVLFHAGPIITRGRITGYRCVLTDVSKHKEYEQKLSAEKATLEHLIDAAPEAIVLTDFDGRILRINKGFTKLLWLHFRRCIEQDDR
ncbi:MAG: PAS domain S-box protein [Marinilabiliales bacterium]|nr:PAS domain S-box protein [Marinilabiliales bacterium]